MFYLDCNFFRTGIQPFYQEGYNRLMKNIVITLIISFLFLGLRADDKVIIRLIKKTNNQYEKVREKEN